jgi:hypothetical protein
MVQSDAPEVANCPDLSKLIYEFWVFNTTLLAKNTTGTGVGASPSVTVPAGVTYWSLNSEPTGEVLIGLPADRASVGKVAAAGVVGAEVFAALF